MRFRSTSIEFQVGNGSVSTGKLVVLLEHAPELQQNRVENSGFGNAVDQIGQRVPIPYHGAARPNAAILTHEFSLIFSFAPWSDRCRLRSMSFVVVYRYNLDLLHQDLAVFIVRLVVSVLDQELV